MPRKPIIPVTMGDPSGIGPEIILKALKDPIIKKVARPLILGDWGVLQRTRISGRRPNLICWQPGQRLLPMLNDPKAFTVCSLSALSARDSRPGVAAKVAGHGTLTLTTGTLLEQPLPYMLPLELARGVVNQVRTQLFEWQSIGLAVSAAISEKIAEATKQLAAAVVHQNNSQICAAESETCLRLALDAGNLLASSYIEQSMIVRRRATGEKHSVFWAGDLGTALLTKATARQFLATFKDYPPRQKAASFTVDQVMDKLTSGVSSA